MVKKQCNHAGYKTLIPYNQTYCDKHKVVSTKQMYQDRQYKDEKYLRFYHSKAWRTLSRQYRLNNPVCEQCLKQGIVRKVNVVDHIVELKDDFSRRLDERNLQSLCHACHNKKTAEEKNRRKTPV